jgi:GH24 family phage-related lysozyme (muramidase)
MERARRKATSIIKEFEGCKLEAYKDIVGIWTIGWGAIGSDIVEGTVWTQEQADKRLETDIAVRERGVDTMVTVSLNENQMAALVSFAFNLGLQALRGSTLMKKLNAGLYKEAAAEFDRWINAGGKPSNGLIRRRAAERKLFETPA